MYKYFLPKSTTIIEFTTRSKILPVFIIYNASSKSRGMLTFPVFSAVSRV